MQEEEPVEIPITDVLDLHAFAPRDMQAAVEAYLEEVHRLGFEAIRIIHGRGIGVQREMVRKVLSRTPCIVHFSDGPAEASGWGATVATLSTRDRKGS
jgi:dsDNA-specific endonuclease/ATPase MutS2